MYFCTVNGNSRAMICTLSRAHWLQSFYPCDALSRFGKVEIYAPINRRRIIIIIIIIIIKITLNNPTTHPPLSP